MRIDHPAINSGAMRLDQRELSEETERRRIASAAVFRRRGATACFANAIAVAFRAPERRVADGRARSGVEASPGREVAG